MQNGQKSKGGKCRSRLVLWKAEPILYNDTALRYFLNIVFRLLSESVIFMHFKIVAAFLFYSGSLLDVEFVV